jgi:hypothetical protein
MEIPDYPSNKRPDQVREIQNKRIRRVTSDDPIRRKKGLGQRFGENFVAGDARSALNYVMFDVLLPAAKDMIAETGSEFLNRLIFGETRRRRGTWGSTPPQSGPTGYVTYNQRYSMGSRQSGPERVISRRARASHDFDEVILQSRAEAEEVIDNLYEVVSQYGVVSVADLYQLVGITASHQDTKWGWTELRGTGVSKVRHGYLLDLPQPVPLD